MPDIFVPPTLKMLLVPAVVSVTPAGRDPVVRAIVVAPVATRD